MRAVYIAYAVMLFSIGCGVVGEFNALAIRDLGYPLVFYGETGYNILGTNSTNLNNTLQQYGMDGVPAQASTSFYMGQGGQMLSTYNAFKDFFMFSTLGLSGFLDTGFPSMPVNMKLIINAAITLNNLIAAISFLRGMVIRWL